MKFSGHNLKEKGKTFLKKKMKWIAALVVLTGCVLGSYKLSRYVEADQVTAKKVQVILDAGHGGSDPGKIGLNNLLEKDINLKITWKIKEYLESKNIVTELTREEDKGLGTSGDGSKKTEDMQARVKKINETAPCIAVSIHQNSYPEAEIHGAQVFYYGHSQDGEKIAKILQESLRKIDPENHRQAKANETYYLLKRTKVPTVIVECGFLTNPEEAEKLSGEEYQTQVAEAVAEGIIQCLNEEDGN